jgi:hypothetical protein
MYFKGVLLRFLRGFGKLISESLYWYLSATPELLQLALQRSEQGDTHDR